MRTLKLFILFSILFGFYDIQNVNSSNLNFSNSSTLAPNESSDWFKMRAYPIGKIGNDGIDINVKLQSFGEKTLIIVKFSYKADKDEKFIATKNPKYKIYNSNDKDYQIHLSSYNYVFTSNDGQVWGFLLEL
jgi:hypothetical protein